MKLITTRWSTKVFMIALLFVGYACSAHRPRAMMAPGSPAASEVSAQESVNASSSVHVQTNSGVGSHVSGSVKSTPASAAKDRQKPVNIRALEWKKARSDFEVSEQAFAEAMNDCASLCKALASMIRAAERLCALASEGTDIEKKKCIEAREQVAIASEKVKSLCGVCPE